MNKTVRIPLSAALILGFAAPALAAFSDVAHTHPYAEAIAYVQDEGIVSGYPDGSYRPDQTVNRAEFIKIVVGANFTAQAVATCDPHHIYDYIDASQDAWYAKYLCLAVQHDIVTGYADGTFRPEVGINAAEAAKIIATTDLFDNGVAYRTLPADNGGAWYERYMTYLVERDALPASVQYPEQSITRGELAEMIYRLAIARGSAQAAHADDSVQTISAFSQGASTAQYKAYEEGVIGNDQTVVLYFYAPWCPYCRANDARLEAWFAQGLADFTVYKVDYDTAADLKGRFGVAVQDTFVKIDAQGEILGSISLPSEETLKIFLGI